MSDTESIRDRAYADAARFIRFQRLWQSYRSALSEPFGKDREADGRITASVDAAFQVLDQLSKEGT